MQPDLAPARPTPGPLPTPMPPPILPPRLILSGGPRMVSVGSGQSVSIEFTVQISGPVVAGPQLAALENTAVSSDTAATISLSVLRLPSGVTAAFSPSSLPASAAPQQFTLTLTATPTALATQSTIQVMAEAAGLVSGIEWVVVTVVSPFSFTPGAPIVPIGTSGQSAVSSQAPVTLKAFGSAVIPVNLQVLAGVTGTISFAVSGQPAAGVTAQFRPPSLSAPPGPGYIAIALTLSAGASLSAGTYTVSCEVLVDSALRGVLTFPLQAVGPSVSSVSPRAGSVPAFLQSGTPVAITGGGFGPGTVVAFGDDTPVAPGSITADGTSLMVTVPPTAASGPLSVITPAGVASGTPDFAVDNYRNTRGFSWVNTQSFQDMLGGSYSGADATALFGAAQTYINIFGIEIFNPLVTVFLAIADAMLDSGGQCYGMSLGSLRFTAGQKGFDGLPSQAAGIESQGPAGPDAWLLDGPPLGNGSDVSPALAAFVHQQHLAQLSQESINNWIGFHLSAGSAAGLRSALEEAFHAGGASGLGAIVCMVPSTAGGHAVVAYEIVDTGGGAFDILTYNPNVPFQVSEDNDRGWRASQAGQSVINVKGDGTWTFRELEYTGGIFNITVVPWNAIPATPTLPWVELAAAGALIAAVIWLVVGDAAVSQVSDGHGHVLLAGGQWNVDPSTMLPGVRPMPSFGGLGKSLPPAFVSNSQATLTHTVSGNTAGSYNLYWVGDGHSVTMTGVPTAPGSADTVQMPAGGVNFTAAADKAVTVAITGLGRASGLPRTATLRTGATGGALTSFSFDAEAETFTYANAGNPASYALELSTTDAGGRPVTLTAPAPPAGSGDTLTFRPDWSQLTAGNGIVSVQAPSGAATNIPL